MGRGLFLAFINPSIGFKSCCYSFTLHRGLSQSLVQLCLGPDSLNGRVLEHAVPFSPAPMQDGGPKLLASGRLVHVFPQWRTEDGIVHLVFTTRRGLPPVVRAFIDHLAGAFRNGNVAS
jgi:hypothetical protein